MLSLILRTALCLVFTGLLKGGSGRVPPAPLNHMDRPIAREASMEWAERELFRTDGQRLHLRDFREKLLLIDFFFTSCPGICPSQTAGLAKVRELLTEEERKALVFASVTIDPSRDGPLQMLAYRERFSIKDENWHFLRGSQADTAALTAYFGTLAPGRDPLEHKARLYLMGPDGKPLMNYPAAPLDAKHLAQELKSAIEVFISSRRGASH